MAGDLTEDAVRNVVLSWYRSTNEHLPVEQVELQLSPDVEMRYPNRDEPLVGRAAFRSWYADVLSRYFDETHEVEKWDLALEPTRATVIVLVRWETRSWNVGAARSEYRAYLSSQRFLIELRKDGRVEIAAKIAETFEPTTPKYATGV